MVLQNNIKFFYSFKINTKKPVAINLRVLLLNIGNL